MFATARVLHATLQGWLVESAYPLWAQIGYDHDRGGFHELLTSAGPVSQQPRRARVQARQIYAFANARSLGWQGDAASLVSQGLAYFFAHYRRSEGLFRTLCAADGGPLDERAFLYDQAFVFLALAESQKILGPQPELLREAQALFDAVQRILKRPGPGFDSGVPERLPLLSNPHMHLLEAALAWQGVSDAPAWRTLAEELVGLALTQLIDPRTGALLECFGEDWLPLPGVDGHAIEPGHLFEWAWLLQRCGGELPQAAARRLIGIGEEHGVHRGLAVNAVLDDFSVHDAQARLWPQAERLKATARLAVVDGHYWSSAVESAQGLLGYLESAPDGLWHDCLTVNGRYVDEPSPASSFYHLVSAIAELGGAVKSAAAGVQCPQIG